MKKFLLTLMACFYLAVASGAGVHLHYCMGNLVKWSVYDDGGHACEFCGMDKTEGKTVACCKDVKHQAEVDQAQKANVSLFKFEQSIVALLPAKPLELVSLQQVTQSVSKATQAHAPPKPSPVALYLKNCTYRI